jgi:hypothetical protein
MFKKSIAHAVMVALCGLGVCIIGAIAQAITNYHPQGYIAGVVVQALVPILTATCAGTIHFLTTQEGGK